MILFEFKEKSNVFFCFCRRLLWLDELRKKRKLDKGWKDVLEFEVIIFKNIVGFEKGGSQPRPLFYKAIDETKLQAIKS